MGWHLQDQCSLSLLNPWINVVPVALLVPEMDELAPMVNSSWAAVKKALPVSATTG